MEIKVPNLKQAGAVLMTVLAIVAAVLAFDDRYLKSDELEATKNEIVGEMRTEIVKNRDVMITRMQSDADDVEYQISQLMGSGEEVPRFLTEKLKTLTRQIEELQDDQE